MPKWLSRLPRLVSSEVVVTLTATGLMSLAAYFAEALSHLAGVPFWVIWLVAALAVVSLVSGVTASHYHRLWKTGVERATALQGLTTNLNEQLVRIADTNRRIAEDLVAAEAPTSFRLSTSYTVALDGNDTIEQDLIVTYAPEHPGRILVIEHWNANAADGEVTWTCSSSDSNTQALAVKIVDEPTRKRIAMYLKPPAEGSRTISLRSVWPGMWDRLRANGVDYVEIRGRQAMNESTVKVHIPKSMGTFEWRCDPEPKFSHRRTEDGSQQTLELVISEPAMGSYYRADIARRQ